MSSNGSVHRIEEVRRMGSGGNGQELIQLNLRLSPR
jgi:hypothetical protein